VIDKLLTLPKSLHLFDGSQKTIVYNTIRNEERSNLSLVKIDARDFSSQLVNHMLSIKLQSVIIEGGLATLNMFIQADLWDEARVFESPSMFQTGLAAPAVNGILASQSHHGDDILKVYRPY
jgi:diaminohydroxyphosphoribosylaminopyrimidine deaminase/5-amino-6-(5-phosphoribosylamino)uracil reductase